MHALPEPGAGLTVLGALPLLAWLGARRRRAALTHRRRAACDHEIASADDKSARSQRLATR